MIDVIYRCYTSMIDVYYICTLCSDETNECIRIEKTKHLYTSLTIQLYDKELYK